MNDLIAAPLQFCADRRFAGAGNALDKIISFAHSSVHAFKQPIIAFSEFFQKRGYATTPEFFRLT
jgi:hypothetical protein